MRIFDSFSGSERVKQEKNIFEEGMQYDIGYIFTFIENELLSKLT